MPKPSEIIVQIASELVQKEDEDMKKEANAGNKEAADYLQNLDNVKDSGAQTQIRNMRVHERLLPALLIYLDNQEEFRKKGDTSEK